MSCMPSLEDSSMIRVVSSAKRDFWQCVSLQIFFVLTCICGDVPRLVEVSDPLSELWARLGIVGQVDPFHEDDGHELSQLILDNFGLQSLENYFKRFQMLLLPTEMLCLYSNLAFISFDVYFRNDDIRGDDLEYIFDQNCVKWRLKEE